MLSPRGDFRARPNATDDPATVGPVDHIFPWPQNKPVRRRRPDGPAAARSAPDITRHLEGTRFSFGEPSGTISQRCKDFSAAVIAGGLKCPVETELRRDIWLKLVGNVAFNPISARARATMADICRHLGTRSLVIQMMRETLDVATRLGAQPSTPSPTFSTTRRPANRDRPPEGGRHPPAVG